MAHGNPALAAALDRGVEAQAVDSTENVLVSRNLGQECPIWSPTGDLTPIACALQRLMQERSLNGVEVTISSSPPGPTGLGSSAASSVAALAAMANFFGITVSSETLFKLAMVSERLIHRDPSGVDVYVAIHGGLVYFKGHNGKNVPLRQRYPVMVSSADAGRNASEMAANIGKFRESTPSLYRTLAKASEKLVEDCRKALEKGDSRVIPEAMNFHQQVLKSMGASSARLDSLVREARLGGFAGAKETDGGYIVGWPETGRYDGSFEKYRSAHPNSFLSYIPSEGLVTWQTPS